MASKGGKARHWQADDFVVTSQTPAYDDSNAVNRAGYCRVCLCDMQSFGGNGKSGPILHYKSHGAAKRRGLWGKRAA